MTNRWHNFFHWADNILRYNGKRILLWRLFRRALYPLGKLELVSFFKRDLTRPLEAISSPQNIQAMPATVPDSKALIKLMEERNKIKNSQERRPLETLVFSRFQKGGLCFIGKRGDRIVHYNWVSFNRAETLEGRYVSLKADEAYCLDAFTLREWRGRGIYPYVHYQALRYLQEKGFRTAYTLVDMDNRPSKKTHYLHGWKAIGLALSFVPRGSSKSWVWAIRGPLAAFLEKGDLD